MAEILSEWTCINCGKQPRDSRGRHIIWRSTGWIEPYCKECAKKNDKDDKDKKLNSADKNPNDGCIYNVRPSLDEPGYLIADFCIYTDRMKEVLREGKVRELSLGYTCIYEQEDGEYEGIPYMFKQTK